MVSTWKTLLFWNQDRIGDCGEQRWSVSVKMALSCMLALLQEST